MSIKELEILRKRARNSLVLGIVLTIVLVRLLGPWLKLPILAFSMLVLGIIISIVISSKPKRKFILAYKQTFVLNALRTVFTNLKYEPDMGIDEMVVAQSKMISMGDRFSSNDYISAKYKDINIEQADIHIEEERETRDSDGNTRTTWVTIFKGRWMVFDFNKTFNGNVQVSQNGFGSSLFNGSVNRWNYKKVMLEDEVFNKQFATYAEKEHEAFYILTPHMMENIKNLNDNINGIILLSFIGNKLHVGISNNKDSFEHSIFKKIKEEKVIEDVSKDIRLITSFVDELNLDNDLFRKEV